MLNVWRAPLANDCDLWGSWNFASRNDTPGFGSGVYNEWLSLGIDKLSHENNIEIMTKTFACTATGGSAFENIYNYLINGNGDIRIKHKIIPHGMMPAYLPKIGLQFKIPNEFQQIQWYGRGLFETYPDRKTGAKMGLIETTVENEYVPYLMPQDYGNKTDVRWLAIANDQNVGMIIKASDPFNFSAQCYATENLDRAIHPFQLREADYTTLNIDYEVSGVGDTAQRTLVKYRVYPGVKEYQITISPFDSRVENKND